MVGKRRRRRSARACRRADDSDLTDGGASAGTGVVRPLENSLAWRSRGVIAEERSGPWIPGHAALGGIEAAVGGGIAQLRELRVDGLARSRPQDMIVGVAVGASRVDGRRHGPLP